MKVSHLIENLSWYKRIYGDRELYYLGRKKDKKDVLFYEQITTIRITGNDPFEPYILCGDSSHELKEEELLKLNWLGRLIKKYIIIK